MSITDELREWFKDHMFKANGWQEVYTIADRIDAEHEEAIQQALMDDGGVPATDENMAEHGWIRLPKDADDVPWNIGDRDEDGNEVIELVLNSDGWYLINGTKWVDKADSIRHYHAPTVEDVLREFTDAILEWAVKSGTIVEVGTWSDVAAEYIAKLQLKEN